MIRGLGGRGELPQQDARFESVEAPTTSARWPVLPLVLITLGLAILAAPSSVEGPVLLPISPGHAISRLDAVALVPLIVGTLGVYAGLWRRRARAYQLAAQSPGQFALAIFAGGFGLGLLIASAFSTFFWWWAIGAVLFSVVLVAAVLLVVRR